MKLHRIHAAVVAIVAGLLISGATDKYPITDWMTRNARVFETCVPDEKVSDLEALRTMVGDARIVALGEGTHGTREFFQLKHRITQFLATEMGFTVFSIEANLPEAWALNDYVLHGRGDPRALIKGMYFWTWNTEEVLAMVEWMRRFNTSKKRRIEFTGFDMQTPDTAFAIVRRFLARHEPAWAESLRALNAMSDPGFVTSTGTLPAAEFAGHKVRYSGFIRTEKVAGFAGLWMRADSGMTRSIAFDNMGSQAVKGTTGWKRYAIDLTIPARADNINFGVLSQGEGTAWFDSLAIEIDGRPWTSLADLALEDPTGPRWRLNRPLHPRYAIEMDSTTAASGARSLRLSCGSAKGSVADRERVQGLRRMVDHLEASRARLGAATSPAETDWIIRNAHVVLQQAMNKNLQSVSFRDSCMAANVAWIADAARKGKKVVLWAHNMHVAKKTGAMGGWLAERYGKDMVVVGFTANEGMYTAWKDGRVASDNVLTPGPPGSIEYFAHETGMPRFLLDLREAGKDSEIQTLLRSGVMMRSIGAVPTEMQFMPVGLGYYDVLAWVDRTEPARQLDTP